MRVALLCCALTVASMLPVRAAVLNFEGLSDLQPVDNFYAGVSFTNAVAYVAGFSLNELELPPASGTTVALNENGLIAIEWDDAVKQFSGRFTYTARLNLQFFLGGAPVGSIFSLFENNLALSGEPGSSASELIAFQRGGGFDALVVDSAGIYGVDDVVYEATDGSVIPEPGTALLTIPAAGAGLLFLALRRNEQNRSREV